jgi:hypothetical protein
MDISRVYEWKLFIPEVPLEMRQIEGYAVYKIFSKEKIRNL